jgi:hypothetical protein
VSAAKNTYFLKRRSEYGRNPHRNQNQSYRGVPPSRIEAGEVALIAVGGTAINITVMETAIGELPVELLTTTPHICLKPCPQI